MYLIRHHITEVARQWISTGFKIEGPGWTYGWDRHVFALTAICKEPLLVVWQRVMPDALDKGFYVEPLKGPAES